MGGAGVGKHNIFIMRLTLTEPIFKFYDTHGCKTLTILDIDYYYINTLDLIVRALGGTGVGQDTCKYAPDTN